MLHVKEPTASENVETNKHHHHAADFSQGNRLERLRSPKRPRKNSKAAYRYVGGKKTYWYNPGILSSYILFTGIPAYTQSTAMGHLKAEGMSAIHKYNNLANSFVARHG